MQKAANTPDQAGAVQLPVRGSGDPDRLPLMVPKSPGGERVGQPAFLLRWLLGGLRLLSLMAVPLVVGAVAGMYFQPSGLQHAMSFFRLAPGGGARTPYALPDATADAFATGRSHEAGAIIPTVRPVSIAGLGKMVPRGDLITIAPPFGAGDARIARLTVEEGDRVETGAILAILDNEGGLKAAALSSQAGLNVKTASLRQVREMTVALRDESRAALARSQSALAIAQRDFDRSRELKAHGFTPEATFDSKQAAFDQAAQDVARAKVTLSRYAADDIDRQADVVLAASNVDAAKADLARADADLERAYVRAPFPATVLTVQVRAGEKPGNLGILNLGNIDEMTVEVEVYQTQIGSVAVGAEVSVSADALPRPLTGKVTRIGLEVGKQTVTDASPAANTDARVVKVYVALSAEDLAIARRFTSLQVTARIATGKPA